MYITTSWSLIIGLLAIILQGVFTVFIRGYPVEICVGATTSVNIAYITKRLLEKKYNANTKTKE